MRAEILHTRRIYDGFFKLDEVRLRHMRYDGTWSEEITRLVFERGDSVGVLLYHRARDTVLLVEQFRCPVFLRGESGLLLEIAAGIQELDKESIEIARQELLEETGYRLDRLEYLLTFYATPGACTERIHLYLGELNTAERVGPGGGAPGEHEDIRLLEVPLEQALRMIERGEIRDGKTIIALQHLALHRRG